MEGMRLDSHVFLEPTRDESNVLDSLGQAKKNKLPLKRLHFIEELKKMHEVDKDIQVELSKSMKE